jgi:hypothetical protein
MKWSRTININKLVLVMQLLILAIFAGACASSETEEPDLCNEGGALFSDEFEGAADCDWQLYSGRGVSEVIENGVLRIETNQPGLIGWTLAGQEIDDVVITTRAHRVEGPDDNAFGIICRYQNPDNYYVFLISSDGHYAIGKFQSGNDGIEYLTGEGLYTLSEAINIGQAENDIQASCVGNQLTLSVNGVTVESVTDPTFVIGDIGLGASTFQPGTAVIEFDHFRAFAP